MPQGGLKLLNKLSTRVILVITANFPFERSPDNKLRLLRQFAPLFSGRVNNRQDRHFCDAPVLLEQTHNVGHEFFAGKKGHSLEVPAVTQVPDHHGLNRQTRFDGSGKHARMEAFDTFSGPRFPLWRKVAGRYHAELVVVYDLQNFRPGIMDAMGLGYETLKPIFAKAPIAGQVKTRLCPPLTHEHAAELFRCFLLDTVERMCSLETVQVFLAITPADSEPLFRQLFHQMIPFPVRYLPQRGDSLGEREINMLVDMLGEGFS